jgi:hypothetical protein
MDGQRWDVHNPAPSASADGGLDGDVQLLPDASGRDDNAPGEGVVGVPLPRVDLDEEGLTDVPPQPVQPSAPALPLPSPAPAPVGAGLIHGQATHYGESYNGQPLGCGPGFGSRDALYHSDDPVIAAVSPARYREWPCGTRLQLCGPAGCAIVIRVDACPGCYANLIDLSEAANRLVCGVPEHTCRVTIEVMQ